MLLALSISGCVSAPVIALSYLQGMAATLIRSQLSAKTSYMAQNSGQAFFVSIGGQDIASDTATRLTGSGITVLPSSSWVDGKGMKMDIALPIPRPDGDFNVNYSFYCGIRCSSVHQAVMRHERHGWTLITSKMLMISRSQQRIKPGASLTIRSSSRRQGAS